MTRGKLALTVIAGLLVFLVVLVFYLPAAWFSSLLPAQVRCGELGGSIWHGECLGLAVQDAELGDATWNFAPTRAFTGRLVGDVSVRGSQLTARADVDTNFRGVGELRGVSAQFPIDPAFVRAMPPDQRGRVSADLKRLLLGDGGAIREAEGTVELRDLRQVGAQPLELGSYQVSFDGKPDPDGKLVGQLRDLGGPMAFSGTLTLTPPNEYVVEGSIQGRSADAERLVRQVTFGAQPDASGRSPFSFAGTY